MVGRRPSAARGWGAGRASGRRRPVRSGRRHAAARRAFPGWAATPWADRQAACNRTAGLIGDNAAELAELLTAEQGKPLPDWHPLKTGDPESTHSSGNSVRGMTLPEHEIPEEDWEDHIIEETP